MHARRRPRQKVFYQLGCFWTGASWRAGQGSSASEEEEVVGDILLTLEQAVTSRAVKITGVPESISRTQQPIGLSQHPSCPAGCRPYGLAWRR